MIDKNLLRSKIVSNGYTQSTFAKIIGMSPQKISSKITGRTKFTTSEIRDISEILSLDKETAWAIFFN